ncbi:hypothetical protein AYI82_06275 [Shewanella algae]|uniref:hypothetical protein n=1 Tax=Shewanella algae TaxID=38313 RepID=UPI001183B7C6|nr:hypothetical protein [Shewanella algae]TVL10621.1 hypothetical protein AYI82_06275 [Shewanella algae]
MTTSTTTKLHPSDRAYITELAHKDWAADRPLNYMPVVLHLPKTKHKARYLLAGLTHYYDQRTAVRPLPEPVELYLGIIKSIAADTAKERKELAQDVYTRFKALSPDPLSDYFKNWIQNKPGDKTDHEWEALDLWLIAQGGSTQTRRKPRSTKPKRKTPGRPRIHYEPEQLQEYIAQHNIENRTQIQKSNRSLYDFFMRRENRHILNELLPIVPAKDRNGLSTKSKVPTVIYTEEQLKEYVDKHGIPNREQLRKSSTSLYNFFMRRENRDILDRVLPVMQKMKSNAPRRPRICWSVEKIRELAAELNGNRSLFYNRFHRGYRWLMDNGHSELYDELFPPKKAKSFTKQELIDRASRFATKVSMLRAEPAAYRQLYKKYPATLARLFPVNYCGRPAARRAADKERQEIGRK